MAAFYPHQAALGRKMGRVILACTVDGQGKLIDCHTEDEIPIGEGFGEAALKMAHLFQMAPMTLNGEPVSGGTVQIPIVFALPGYSDPTSAMLACYGVMATKAEADPSDGDAWHAARFWALQAMAAAANAHIPPSHVEHNLEFAHVAAANDPDKTRTRMTSDNCNRVMKQAEKP